MIRVNLKIRTSFINLKNLKNVVFPEMKKFAIVSKGIEEMRSIINQVFR